ncbi:uncharacterized protein I303_102657 [Kwoniella dejecticola CBS 10117]|uniref:Bis(5'-adenosyl)-triphosphatase n=1 Tax=Kwoniella dejecticola CBS 10117 TaxID=1296121 RepID=A0A1A6A9C8_9TREE|nr:bis(5'-adenosyl)-triphosphatase [Kwoniella dejecticola CBS 10117]OBR86661.1 bis(5'-adenosyl)-triphosphatase [Kwoniella dejecticola CBS 10117]
MTVKHLFSVFDVTKQVFYTTPLSIGIVNLKPLLPGHVLILPKRVVPRLADLRPNEVSDLFLTVQKVGRGLEQYYKAQALTVSLQDGASAGQSVPHVHVHILPRHSTDFDGENDKIYPLLEENEARLKDDLDLGLDFHLSSNTQPKESRESNGTARKTTKQPEGTAKTIGRSWEVSDQDRTPRAMEEMVSEAQAFERFFESLEGP